MTPEMKAALLQMLQGGDSPAGGHADAAQDYEQICEVVENKLAPVFTMIGEELKSQREEIAGLKDIIYKMVTSFSDSVGQHKRQGLQSTIMGKYGSDLEALKPVYSDFRGSDIVEDLIGALMEADGNPEELAGQFIEQAKGKFGKYLGGTPAPGKEVSVEIEAVGEPVAEEKAEEVAEEKAPEADGKQDDPAMKILNQVRSLRGARKTA
jgi:phage-related minor tail protein